MTSGTARSFLPVPEITDENLRHSKKQLRKRDIKKPPKLNRYDTGFNRSGNSSSAHLISFRDSSGSGEELLSPFYNKSNSVSYFDQCFDVLSKIGEGSFGEVFKVKNKEDGLLYAVKKSKQFFRSEGYRQERLEEVKRYEQFSNHDHCVTLYNAWEQGDRLFMQMELCQGSLENYIERKGQISEKKIWSILLDLLLALKGLHDRNLIHLDIKLENILVGDDGTCKLGDFGLVVDVDRANLSHATEGDSRYIAPELLQGHFSKAADIFSLGIAILELSCNLELPPNGFLWQQLRSGIFPEEFITQVSPALQEMIKSMMSPDPFQRPTVDLLLTHRRLVAMQRRRRWEIFKRFRRYFRKTRRLFWAKMCNLKNIVNSIFVYILIMLKLKEPVYTKEDSFSEEFLNTSSAQNSPIQNFSSISIRFINSTPINPHATSFRRSRKDLSKTSFRHELSNGVSDHSSQQEPSSMIMDGDNQETYSVICKKLFSKSDDSD